VRKDSCAGFAGQMQVELPSASRLLLFVHARGPCLRRANLAVRMTPVRSFTDVAAPAYNKA
jgi:hypothetical protein